MSTNIYSKISFLSDNSSVLSVSFFDYNEEAKQPNTVSYSIYDESGEIVNGKEDVVVTPGTTTLIELEPDDLTNGETDTTWERYIDIFGTFNCTVDGTSFTNQDYKRRVTIEVTNYKYVLR